ncbi:MAG TPA: hypothetical protein PKW76_10285 [bacterium]|nr:hypothetical protein [bacterium]HPG46059.1 hypothetical protein [bacterium]HPM98314.1 hypothetical protein [bacterium]
MEQLFITLSSKNIAELVNSARRFILYAAPGIQKKPAWVIANAAQRLGSGSIAVYLDFDERVLRMGFGSLEAASILRASGIEINHAPGLRTGLLISDDAGYIFAPTALYLEPEPYDKESINAMRLLPQQLADALSRFNLSHAKAVVNLPEQNQNSAIQEHSVEIMSEPVSASHFGKIEKALTEVPPVQFDLARQVRVFSAYLQYVEIHLKGAAIQRHKINIPKKLIELGAAKEVARRLRTTFDLILNDDRYSSDSLEAELNEIRQNFTKSLGSEHGRLVLKAAKPLLEKRLAEFKEKLEQHQKTLANVLQGALDESRNLIVEYYLPLVLHNPPDCMRGQLFNNPSEADVRRWIDKLLDKEIPKAEQLVQAIEFKVYYKDITFETLNQNDFIELVKANFPAIDWDKPFTEFIAARSRENGRD